MKLSRKIAIIGCGYIGSAIGAALTDAGHDVVGTTTSPARQSEIASHGIRSAVLDAADAAALRALLADRDTAYLTLAAGGHDRDYARIYLTAAQNLIAAIAASPVRRVIYTSSTGVYGQNDGGWVDEHSPTEPDSANGRVLVETERVLLDGAAGLGPTRRVMVSVVRLGGIYGPGRDPAAFILQSAGQTRRDGDAYVNMVHRDDIVAALVALLEVEHHGVLNLTDDQPGTRREFYDAKLAARDAAPIQWEHDATASNLGKRVCNRRIKELLGLRLKHPSHCGQ